MLRITGRALVSLTAFLAVLSLIGGNNAQAAPLRLPPHVKPVVPPPAPAPVPAPAPAPTVKAPAPATPPPVVTTPVPAPAPTVIAQPQVGLGLYGRTANGPLNYWNAMAYQSLYGYNPWNMFNPYGGFSVFSTNPYAYNLNAFNGPFGFNNPYMMNNQFMMGPNGFNPFMMPQNGFNNPVAVAMMPMNNGFNNQLPMMPQNAFNPMMNPVGWNPWNNVNARAPFGPAVFPKGIGNGGNGL